MAVSYGVYDAWKANPPCTYVKPYCSPDCPYHEECHGSDDEDEDDDLDEDDY